jgi:hypothetical protein
MHYVTRISNRMQKYKFDVTCPGELFVESILVPPEHEELCVDVSRLGCTRMHYVTRKSHRMQQHKLGITCPNVLFVESTLVPPGHEK